MQWLKVPALSADDFYGDCAQTGWKYPFRPNVTGRGLGAASEAERESSLQAGKDDESQGKIMQDFLI